MADLDDRAAAIFGAGPNGIYWPYDASGIDTSLRRTDAERFRQQLDALSGK
ncbi:hypothetical protein HEP87_09270 [Streptomyces sp. S1D4-11]|nr:hypothetical protein [Streptomyces sp. S1D4-11]QIY94196.1 hypothetical protein HEP87_09270 [Streptomyces sp. S1D4-11]